MHHTSLFKLKKEPEVDIKKVIKDVARTLEQENYHAIDQLVGYLQTGDPIYITSKKDARNKMRDLDRSKVIRELLKEYLQ